MKVTLRFGIPGYIADPYWPEVYKTIEIRKRSGVDRMRSEAKIRSGLESYLRKEGLDLPAYEALVVASKRPFYTSNGNGSGSEIVIPGTNVLSCLVNANDVAASRMRIDSIRSTIAASDFATGKHEPDGSWGRYAVVKSGTGNKLSNQRGWRESKFIRDFDAVGDLSVDAEMVKPDAVIELLRFAGLKVGIGASRKMGYGRFHVVTT